MTTTGLCCHQVQGCPLACLLNSSNPTLLLSEALPGQACPMTGTNPDEAYSGCSLGTAEAGAKVTKHWTSACQHKNWRSLTRPQAVSARCTHAQLCLCAASCTHASAPKKVPHYPYFTVDGQ